jgi:GDPmannose 4,6-dehydratase
MFATNGILFNHESPLRGETFVTRKITRAAARIKHGLDNCLYLGNLDAKRDWGHAKEYVDGMWRMLQAQKPSDYVLATNRTTPVRDFVRMAFAQAGIEIAFRGQAECEEGFCTKTGKVLVKVDPAYYRPTEVDLLIGNPAKAKKELNWDAKIPVEELCKEMVMADLYRTEQELHERKHSGTRAEELAHSEFGFLPWFEKQGHIK